LDDNWSPYKDEIQFRTADFLFCQVEMSAGNIDTLLEIWALSMAKSNNLGPFESYKHMYATIDSTELGNAPWKCFLTSFADKIDVNAPSWQSQSWEVWYCNSDVVIWHMLNNPDFDGSFDYTLYIGLDKAGKCRWNDFMSGNFSWRRAVSISTSILHPY
jgi:hypothetical protein